MPQTQAILKVPPTGQSLYSTHPPFLYR